MKKICILFALLLGFGGAFASTALAADCSRYNHLNLPPAGFGAPHDVLSSRQDLWLATFCDTSGMTFHAGVGANDQYIYEKGYILENGKWKQFDFDGPIKNGAWFHAEASKRFPLTAAQLKETNYVVAYICTRDGSSWKCGCRDRACLTKHWMLQSFKYDPPGPPTGLIGELDKPFDLSVKETITVDQLKMTLLEITDDSRCPINAFCVWQGTIATDVELDVNGVTKTVNISQVDGPHEFEGYTITIRNAAPSTKAGQPIAQDEYAITYVVSEASGPVFTETELKYKIEAETGQAVLCGPPVVPSNYNDILLKQFPNVEADTEAFEAILAHLNYVGKTLTDTEKVQIVNEYNRLAVVLLEELKNGNYEFEIASQDSTGAGYKYTGTITPTGVITITTKEPHRVICPICLSGGTMIATPDGDIAVENITDGMQVWSVDEAGNRVESTVAAVGKTPTPASHRVVHLQLNDGREVFVSPGHPTNDGRTVGELQAGDTYDGTTVAAATLVPYHGAHTYDLLPDSATGTYFADGILLGSTLSQ